mgnify:CR=1 FL=1
MVVIGLGKAGCNIAEMFKSYDNYKVFTYDGGKNVPLNESSEGYENGFPNKRELKKIKNETVWFFVCGAGKIAGATLRLLEQIKENKINVVYIVPDASILPDTAKKRNRVAAGVLQEYARSGLLNSIYLVSNNSLEQIVGEAPLASYYSKMNEYWQENGEITDKHYKELEKAGFPRSLVDTHLDGLRNQATVMQSDLIAIKNTYGGEDAFTAMQYWARDNLTDAEKAAYSKGINGDLETVKLTVAGLHARYANAVGNEPNLISGKAASYSSDKFESTAQLEEAMNDPRYKKDPAYRAKVEDRLSRSSIF